MINFIELIYFTYIFATDGLNSNKNKVVIATSTSTIFAFMLLTTSLFLWRLMNRIKSLNDILGGEIALTFFKLFCFCNIYIEGSDKMHNLFNSVIKRI